MQQSHYIAFVCTIFTLSVIAVYGLTHRDSTNAQIDPTSTTYPYALPPLPYSTSALEPSIDAETMRIHHDKHHQKYVDELNKALEKHPELHKKTLLELLTTLDDLPQDIKIAIRNNGGGHLNHSQFWLMMKPEASIEPTGKLKQDIDTTFGSFEEFKKKFDMAAQKRFGSGWAWLCVTPESKLVITSTADQDTPYLKNLTPILGLDVWEHAYYLKYQNKRPEYIIAWWNVVNWKYVENAYANALKS